MRTIGLLGMLASVATAAFIVGTTRAPHPQSEYLVRLKSGISFEATNLSKAGGKTAFDALQVWAPGVLQSDQCRIHVVIGDQAVLSADEAPALYFQILAKMGAK